MGGWAFAFHQPGLDSAAGNYSRHRYGLLVGSLAGDGKDQYPHSGGLGEYSSWAVRGGKLPDNLFARNDCSSSPATSFGGDIFLCDRKLVEIDQKIIYTPLHIGTARCIAFAVCTD